MLRSKFTKVNSAKGRKISSKNWLQRQLNDPFVIKSRVDGYRSRAAYKLIEINDKFKIIKNSSKIIDLGAAPGGWSQVSSAIAKNGKIVAIDLLEMDKIESVEFFQGDFCDEETVDKIKNLFGEKADIVMSDIAPNTTGHKHTDHLKILDICERVFEFSKEILDNHGSMIFKIFQGGAESELLSEIKKYFQSVKHFKPGASRKDSSEIYLIATGFKRNITIK